MSATIRDHNLQAAAMWSAGGRAYDEISRGIAVVSGLDDARRDTLRRAFCEWAEPFRAGLGITIPIDYPLTVGERI
jgi:hypothetical protein